jgi:magnesium transporter
MLDSVVDSFFPLVEEIGEDVAAIESLVANEDSLPTITDMSSVGSRSLQAKPAAEKFAPSISFIDVDEKHVLPREIASVKTAKTQFSLPRLTCGLMWRRLRRALSQSIGYCMRSKPRKVKPSFTRTTLGLHRMARTRRLVTSVARVLATKPEVIAGIRKRLLASHGSASSDATEVAIYFGDVQGETKRNRSVCCMN